MFSKRLHWDLQPNPISKLLAAKRAAGVSILDLTESNPTNAQLDYPVEELVAAFANPEMLRYQPDPAGLLSAREAVSDYYRRQVPPERIFLTASTSEAYSFLFKLLTDPGDQVLVPRPSYPLFDFLAGMELVEVVHYPLFYDGVWGIDFEALQQLASSRTRAIVLVNPNNPTGSFLHTHELEPLVEFCRQRQIAIISDEVFSEYGFGEKATRVESLRCVADVLTFCLSGLSKVAALPQVKLGWILVNGPTDLVAAPIARLELIADTYLSVGTPVQAAAPHLLKLAPQIGDQIRGRTARNLKALPQALHVEGGWYATLRVPRVRSEEEWTLDLLEHDNVLVQPGFFYDFPSEAFLILSLLTPPDIFDRGIARISSRMEFPDESRARTDKLHGR